MTDSRLVLGTAQLGMPYGVGNTTGQPDLMASEGIVRAAWGGGIRRFDTARSYGMSESVLGSVLKKMCVDSDAKIISKINLKANARNPRNIRKDLENSLTALGVKKLFGVLIHNEEALDTWNDGIGQELTGCVADGLLERFGVSVYSPERAVMAIETEGISMIQIPSNVLDRRFEDAGVFNDADKNGKEIYVRSVFLQGLLVMKPEKLPRSMVFALKTVEEFNQFAKEIGIGKKQLALGYARIAFPKAKIVFGAETDEQVVKNLDTWNNLLPMWVVERARERFQKVEEKILNPSRWPK